jgi:predicted SnoaL-like aldol condensation-catalyzing enzyme
MNKERQRKAIARKFMKKPVTKFSEIVLENQPFIPKGMTKAYSNNRYVVMIYENSLTTSGSATRCMIQKIDNTPILNHWSEIQKIKNAWGKNYDAISQYYNELNKENRGSTNVAQKLADFIDNFIDKRIDENSAQTTATINSISKTSELRKRLADAKTDSEKISILTQIRDIEAAEEKAAKLKNPS